jgi:hypothetical protein
MRMGLIVASVAAVAGGPASGQTRDDLRERFREECRAHLRQQLQRLRGPEHRGERSARVGACMKAKFVARARGAGTRLSRSELKLIEANLWLTANNRGPEEAKGIIYFVRGWAPKRLPSHVPGPYVLKTFSEGGWDVISASEPHGFPGLATDAVGRAAAFMRRRVSEFKKQGYKRVILAGHSWGAWGALLAAQGSDFAADALLLSAPNTFGKRISSITGGPNPYFGLTLSEFADVIAKVRTPTVLILPDDDPYIADPGKLGTVAEKHFARADVAHFVLAKPPAFSGHFAAWLPVFDYAYGRCIEAFIESPAPKSCSPAALSVRDFRSIVDLKQVADAEGKSVASAEPLTGKKFVVYALAERVMHYYEYVSPTQRKHAKTEGTKSEGVSFRDGFHCAGGQCNKLLVWSEGQLLEFEPKSGKLVAWWVEKQ